MTNTLFLTMTNNYRPRVVALYLSDNELKLLRLICTDLPLKSIANKLHISNRTLERMKEDLFEKFGVSSRTGLAIFALNNAVVTATEIQSYEMT